MEKATEPAIKEQPVYEEMAGKPVCFFDENYHKVLLSQATIEAVMGVSESPFVVKGPVLVIGRNVGVIPCAGRVITPAPGTARAATLPLPAGPGL